MNEIRQQIAQACKCPISNHEQAKVISIGSGVHRRLIRDIENGYNSDRESIEEMVEFFTNINDDTTFLGKKFRLLKTGAPNSLVIISDAGNVYEFTLVGCSDIEIAMAK